MTVRTGLDELLTNDFKEIQKKKIALLCNQASITGDFQHAVDIFTSAHNAGKIVLKCLIGPQHGLWGHTQDNMIEWKGYTDSRTHIPVFSLYGKHREPTLEMLNNVDTLVLDLQDVGAKYYTFIWSMFLSMKACEKLNIDVIVLDRPNPIGGEQIEGPFVNDGFLSFVGLASLGLRHAMTIGEIAKYFNTKFFPGCKVSVVEMKNWKRNMYFADTKLPWFFPSPNIPTAESCVVYPGMCLLEATNLSEGRGTTRPFEIFGAAWMDGWRLAETLKKYNLPGVVFRPLEFQPTFHKHANKVCGGCFIHVTDRSIFKPILTAIAILLETMQLYPDEFQWKQPPYEYEYEKMPFDILVGNDWLRKMMENKSSLMAIEEKWAGEENLFKQIRQDFLLY